MLCSTISAFTHVFDGISAFTRLRRYAGALP
jgi:hypothetical protein